ncbi:Glucosylceramidase [Hypsibius exemplaris]|uniref:Glucosylceramidase n=1 Tax=Hypsibius exemplaris TaxID=2072580 RepID=A0A1W0X5A8_HYPEX|nr:Glucosylceramidase [Hypsibius exemplaris]
MEKRYLLFICLSILTFCLAADASNAEAARPCNGRRYSEGDSIVCVCSGTYCDDLTPIVQGDIPAGQFLSYRSSRSGDRFLAVKGTIQPNGTRQTDDGTDPTGAVVDAVFTISNAGSYQSLIGFGGAMTDAAAINIMSLSEAARKSLLDSYYSETGSEYSVGRVPMASCDFSTHVYSYDETPGDFDLKDFKLTTEDLDMKIPLLKQAQATAKAPLKIFGSVWTAPAWLKTSGRENTSGQLIGQAGDKYHKTWAQYFVKFVQSYEAQNVSIWGLTTQNEPIDGYIPMFPFQALGFTPASQRDFIAKDLGPALAAANLQHLKLIIMDDQRFLLPNWADTVLADDTAAGFVDGIGVHWYFDGLTPASVLTKTHNRHPDKFILSTEACQGSGIGQHKVILGDWSRGESYAQDIIENLQNWVGGWVDWNLALNTEGGPNWAKNQVDSPIIVNATADEFYKQPMYYALAHFSKFLPPNSVILKSNLASTTNPWGVKRVSKASGLQIVAAQRPDGGLVTMVMNKGKKDVTLKVVDGPGGGRSFVVTVQARSIQSFVWW